MPLQIIVNFAAAAAAAAAAGVVVSDPEYSNWIVGATKLVHGKWFEPRSISIDQTRQTPNL